MKRLIPIIIIVAAVTNLFSVTVAGEDLFDVVDEKVASYIMSWQLDSGGWTKDKDAIYERYWDGSEKKAKYYQLDKVTPLGTIDNDATVGELRYLAKVYDQYGGDDVKESIIRGLEYLLEMQYPSGGFPQVYPVQDHPTSIYENDATFNDNAMINVLILYGDIIDSKEGFSSELVTDELHKKITIGYYRGIDYILSSQVMVDGKKTAWGGQHDPVTYETTRGRAFEPISLISKESVRIVKFLEGLTLEEAQQIQVGVDDETQVPVVHEITQERIDSSIVAAKAWLMDVAVLNTRYYRKGLNGSYFVRESGKLTWYRFYEIGTNEPLFGDVDGSVTHDILEISEERRHGYGWAGTWGKDIYISMVAEDVIVDDEIPAALPELDEEEEHFEQLYEEEHYRESVDQNGRQERNRIILMIGFVALAVLVILIRNTR